MIKARQTRSVSPVKSQEISKDSQVLLNSPGGGGGGNNKIVPQDKGKLAGFLF